MAKLLALIVLLFVPVVAFAQEAASQAATLPDDMTGVLAWFRATHTGGNWSLLIGGVITLLVRLLTLLKPLADKLPPEATKWVAMALAMLGSIATGLMAGVVWYKVLADGVQVGAAALGGWEFILKPLLGKLGLSKSPTGSVVKA